MKISVVYWRNDADRGKPTYLDKTPSYCHLVNDKSHVDLHRVEPGI